MKSALWICTIQMGALWICTFEMGALRISLFQMGALRISLFQMGALWICMFPMGALHISLFQMGALWMTLFSWRLGLFCTCIYHSIHCDLSKRSGRIVLFEHVMIFTLLLIWTTWKLYIKKLYTMFWFFIGRMRRQGRGSFSVQHQKSWV